MANIFLTAWKSIREKIEWEWREVHEYTDYVALADSWGVTSGTIWRILESTVYVPSSLAIRNQLLKAYKEKGYEMPEVRHRIRIDLPADADPDLVKRIRTELTDQERLRALRQGLLIKDYSKGRRI